MKRRKIDVMVGHNIWDDSTIKINKEESGEYYFEIGEEITTDLAEAVSILMRIKSKWNDKIWELELSEIDYYNIDPEKCLYWLSGGKEEWSKNENYKKCWWECSMEFQEEFGLTIISILKNSKKLKDIRDGFVKYLNLPTIYDFALERGIA